MLVYERMKSSMRNRSKSKAIWHSPPIITVGCIHLFSSDASEFWNFFHAGMQRSRQSVPSPNLPKSTLLENYSIMIKCDGCQEMMNTEELIELVRLSGAKHTTDSHFSRSQTGITRIVLCEKEYLMHRQEMYNKCIHAGVQFLTPEW